MTQIELDAYARVDGVYRRREAKFTLNPSQALAYAVQYAKPGDDPLVLMLHDPSIYDIESISQTSDWRIVRAKNTPIDVNAERLFPRDDISELVDCVLRTSGIEPVRELFIYKQVLADVTKKLTSRPEE